MQTKMGRQADRRLGLSAALMRAVLAWTLAWAVGGLVACGGSGSSGDTANPPAPTVLAPSISANPVSVTAQEGASASFTVNAGGSTPLSYQWQRDGVNIAGATAASYALAASTAGDNGASFRVVVTNAAGSVTSTAVTLTVNVAAAAPSILSQPVGTTVTPGTPANFSVLAAGSAALTYQWQRDGTDMAGATSASYSLASPSASDSGATFRVRVTNAIGSVTSANALLTVAQSVTAPSILTQPQSLTGTDGAPIIFSVAASGTGPFSYQWRKNGVAIAGATLSLYVTPILTVADSASVYSVVVTNGGGSVTSDNAKLTVNYLPADWLVQPTATSVAVGQSAQFISAAFGSQPMSYQWKRNGVVIAGATDMIYYTPAVVLADDGALYSVVATNPANSITSAAVRLTVLGAAVAPSIATAPANATVTAGQNATFTVVAAGTGPFSYQWRRNGNTISGATAASYTTAATAVADNAAQFTVMVTNAAGSVTSAAAVLTVQAATGGLNGRAWAAGQLLETDDNVVRDSVSGIDDAGRVTVVFRKSNGTRDVIYATRGIPNAASVAPTWSTPVAIDVLAGVPVSTMGTIADYDLVVTPGGNAVAYWFHKAACSTSSYSTSGNCLYYYLARFTAGGSTWSAPELIGDAPAPNFTLLANDRGDIALLGTSWVRSGTSSYTSALALSLRYSGETSFRRRLLNTESLGKTALSLDAQGNLMLAAEKQQNGTTDLVVYRGTVAFGLDAPMVLDTRGASASLDVAAIGLNGQQAVTWIQNNGVKNTTFAAVSSSATSSFTVTDLNLVGNSSFRVLTPTDDGRVLLYDISGTSTRRDWSPASGWSASVAMPSKIPLNNYYNTYGITRAGDILAAETVGCCSYGGTATYDASRNVMISTVPTASVAPGFVLGFSTSGVGYGSAKLSLSGVGFLTMQNTRDVLPTPTVPAGDGRPAVTNLWGAFFK